MDCLHEIEIFACNKRGVDKCRENLEDASSARLKTYSLISGEKFKLQSVEVFFSDVYERFMTFIADKKFGINLTH